MARNRMIKPEFWEDEKVGELSFGARLLFIGSLNYADDEGFLRWNTEYLQSSIFIYDKLSKNKIKSFMKELENLKIVEVFETKNHFFVAKIKNFTKHQKISHPQPSKFSIDLEQKTESEVLKNQCESEENSVNDSVNDSVNYSVNDSTPKEVNIKEVKRKKEKEKEKESGDTPQTPFLDSSKNQTAKTANDLTAIPKGYQELVDYLMQNYNCPEDNAKLIANRVQSDKVDLSFAHCEEFTAMTKDQIISYFEAMKKLKQLRGRSKMVNVANVLNRA